MSKKFIIFTITLLLLLGICGTVLAVDTHNATSQINDVTVNWSYTLNDSDQIENLKCTNPGEITGNIEIPSTIEEKTVVKLGSEAFKSATQLTGVTIPDSIKEIGSNAFNGCTSLTDVDLGSITDIGNNAFQGCTALESITIPKTLKYGAVVPIFNGCTKLTEIILEDGLTIVPSYLCASTNIKSIEIPNSVTKVDSSAFKNCTSLTDVDLGSITDIGNNAFQDCTALESITIPKTLKNGAVVPIFNGCTKLTKIILEEGLTIVPSYLCASTNIKSIEIPNSVTEIDSNAFNGCTSLTDVDLGSITDIGNNAFQDCTALESITIPKTLKNGAVVPIFNGCTMLTEIVLEEGLTIVPSYLCASANIESIEIPNSVTEIDYSAFDDCTKLKKITILDNVKKMGFFSIEPNKDSVFNNHNEDLTIYCYKDSIPAQYAINNKIKYVYLTRPTTEKPTDSKENEQKDNTTAPGNIPQTGVTMTAISISMVIILISIVLYKKNKDYKDIK